MAITVKPCSFQARPVSMNRRPVQDHLTFLEDACKKEHEKCSKLLQSSLDISRATKPSPNGFVNAAIEAYNNHHHLQLRPEDIWFAILSQLSFYINAHAEELRGKLVAHKGKKELFTISFAKARRFIDFGEFATTISNEIDKNVLVPGLKEWVMPAFSTTTEQDKIVASVLFMGSLQEYFGYVCYMRCGLPSVTLLGERADWENILSRLDKLKEFGDEPTQFCALLKPVISRFILSFSEPETKEVKSFWNRIAHRIDMGSSVDYYSGWISAFCFWNLDGRTKRWNHDSGSGGREANPPEPLRLDGVAYEAISEADLPPGFSSVPFKIDDFGEIVDAVMVAGSVGLKYTKSDVGKPADTIGAETGWWVFESIPDQDTTQERNPK